MAERIEFFCGRIPEIWMKIERKKSLYMQPRGEGLETARWGFQFNNKNAVAFYLISSSFQYPFPMCKPIAVTIHIEYNRILEEVLTIVKSCIV